MGLAAAEVPGEPARDVAEGQPARLRPLPERGVGFDEPGELRRGEGRVERQARLRPRRVRFGRQRGAELGGALILPAHHGRDRSPGLALPEQEGLGLARDADPGDSRAHLGDDVGDRLQRPGQELAGIVLDQARRRAPGRHRPAGRPTLLQTPVVGDAASARAALVESEDHVHRHAACLSGRDRAVSVWRRGADVAAAGMLAAICAYATAIPLSIIADTSVNRTCGSTP